MNEMSNIILSHDIIGSYLKKYPETLVNQIIIDGCVNETLEGLRMLYYYLINLLCEYDVYGI